MKKPAPAKPASSGEARIAGLLEALCDHFDDELERQQNILDVCRAQGAAVLAHDRSNLENKAAALALLIQETATAEEKRLMLVREIVDAFALPAETQTLSGLIEVVDQPWRLRMQEFQVQMQATLAATKEVVRENNSGLRRSLRIVNETLHSVVPAFAGGQQYTPAGVASASAGAAVLGTLDHQG